MGDRVSIEIHGAAAAAYEELRGDRQRTLVGPEDDMWATFADLGEPYSLTRGGRLAGRFSVDEEQRLHGFYVSDDFEAMSAGLLSRVVTELDVSAAMTSTVDPVFLSLCLTAGGTAEPTGLVYHHVADPTVTELVEVRTAVAADHAAAVTFCRAELEAPEAFLNAYLGERIDRGELHLVEVAEMIVASGECRVDRRAPGNAHLGLVVGAELRGKGLGARLMHTLTGIALEQGLTPRCSTEPANLAAQTVIRHAGFRTRHQVFRVTLPAS